VAYIIGLLTVEEEKKLAARGWEVEPAPAALIDAECEGPERMRMVWVDSSIVRRDERS